MNNEDIQSMRRTFLIRQLTCSSHHKITDIFVVEFFIRNVIVMAQLLNAGHTDLFRLGAGLAISRLAQ